MEQSEARVSNVIPEAIARKYADALFRAFDITDLNGNKLTAIENALINIASLWQSSADLRDRIESPSVIASEKDSALFEIGKLIAKDVGVEPEDYFARFLVLLQENGRIGGISQVAAAFTALVKQLRQELKIEVITASKLSEDERSKISQGFKAKGSSPLFSIEWTVDPKIIGGAVVRCGGKQIDGSVRGALKNARTVLMSR